MHGDSPYDNPEIAREMAYGSDQFTHILEPDCDIDLWQCVNCGAHAPTVEEIKHYGNCRPGEAAKWGSSMKKKTLQCPKCGSTNVIETHPFDYVKTCMNDKCPYYVKHPKKWRYQFSTGEHN